MEERELKALEIAAKSKLTRRGKTWLVPSQSVRGAQYTVKADPHARSTKAQSPPAFHFLNHFYPNNKLAREYFGFAFASLERTNLIRIPVRRDVIIEKCNS